MWVRLFRSSCWLRLVGEAALGDEDMGLTKRGVACGPALEASCGAATV